MSPLDRSTKNLQIKLYHYHVTETTTDPVITNGITNYIRNFKTCTIQITTHHLITYYPLHLGSTKIIFN